MRHARVQLFVSPQNPEPFPEVLNPKPEALNPKARTRTPKPESLYRLSLHPENPAPQHPEPSSQGRPELSAWLHGTVEGFDFVRV